MGVIALAATLAALSEALALCPPSFDGILGPTGREANGSDRRFQLFFGWNLPIGRLPRHQTALYS